MLGTKIILQHSSDEQQEDLLNTIHLDKLKKVVMERLTNFEIYLFFILDLDFIIIEKIITFSYIKPSSKDMVIVNDKDYGADKNYFIFIDIEKFNRLDKLELNRQCGILFKGIEKIYMYENEQLTEIKNLIPNK